MELSVDVLSSGLLKGIIYLWSICVKPSTTIFLRSCNMRNIGRMQKENLEN